MRKTLFILTAILMIFSLLGCKETVFELALITDSGDVNDSSFNQLAWEAVSEYSQKNNVKCKYYRPLSNSITDISEAIKTAVTSGAKVIVLPSRMFEVHAHKAQTEFPEVKFILIDGIPHNSIGMGKTYNESGYNETIAPNTLSIRYNEGQAAFLAGYAVIKEGYRNLGFIGGEQSPSVIKYGYGFLQGAEYAANELKLKKGEVTIRYFYTAQPVATEATQKKAASWFANGTEVIFTCGGSVGDCVMVAATAAQTKVIGVDIDQSHKSSSVITSATKNLKQTIIDAVDTVFTDTFLGGQSIFLGADTNSIGLSLSSSKFQNFTQEEYVSIFKLLAENDKSIVIKNESITDVKNLGLKLINVQVEQ